MDTFGLPADSDHAVITRGGGSFIGLWMGPSYSQISGTVLQILVLFRFFAFANVAGCGIMLGTEKQKPMALAGLAEALANLALSIALVHRFGVFGVA
jgi:O-antigen/teichoic acid export membrane protein